jgi:TonB family protein
VSSDANPACRNNLKKCIIVLHIHNKHRLLQIYPEYIGGGYVEASTFIQENLRYTDDMGCIEGTVYLEFIVDTLGLVKDVAIRRGISAAADAEAIRVIQLLSFIPGKSDGKVVETKMVWPVRFTFYEDEEE